MDEIKKVTEKAKEVTIEDKKPDSGGAVTIILDSIFNKGFYEEEMTLPSNHKCVLRTRSAKQGRVIAERMEADSIKTQQRYDQVYGTYCLGAALCSLDGKNMPDDFDKKLAFIDTWSLPLIDILIKSLVEFDKKVTDAYTLDNAKNS